MMLDYDLVSGWDYRTGLGFFVYRVGFGDGFLPLLVLLFFLIEIPVDASCCFSLRIRMYEGMLITSL